MIPEEVREGNLVHLDPESSLVAPLVCKNWDRRVRSGRVNLLNVLKESSSEELTHTRLLRALLFHREPLSQIHHTLAPHFYEYIATCERSGEITVLPEGMERFIETIKGYPASHLTLTRMYVNLDPLHDWQTVWWASHVVQQVPALQGMLKNVMEENVFDLKKFKLIVKGKENQPLLKRYLMALKLLADVGNKEAKARLFALKKSMSDWIPTATKELLTKTRTYKFIHAYPDFYTWPLYTGECSIIEKALLFLRTLVGDSYYSSVCDPFKMDLNDLEKFGGVVFTLFPSLNEEHQEEFEKK